MFAGAGIALAIAGVFSFLILPLFKLGQHLCELKASGDLSLAKLSCRVSLLVAGLVALLFLLPAELRRTSPGIVEYDPPSILRAPAKGFVDEVRVDEGDHVEQGQVIAVLRNDELQVKLQSLKIQLEQSMQLLRAARWVNDSSKAEEEQTNIASLRTQLEEMESQMQSLVICAPHSGKVVARGLKLLKGRYVDRGTEMGAIGNESSKRIKVSVSEWEASRSDEWRQKSVRIAFAGAFSWNAQVSHLESRASDHPADPSLTAVAGGYLPVREQPGAEEPVLIEPRVNAYIALGPKRSRSLLCGQRCHVLLSCWQQSLGGWILSKVREFSVSAI